MKMTAKLVLAAAIGASMSVVCAWGQDEAAAYSANAVGVIKYTIPAGGRLTCITLPLNPMGDATNDVWNWSETTLAQQLDRGSIAYFWVDSEWKPSTKQRSTWTVENQVAPGQAVFVQGPEGASEDKVIALLGELPVASTNYLSLVGSNNLNMSAISTYPVSRTLSESALADLPRSSIIYKWDGEQWIPSTKQRSSWTVDFEFAVGEGAFVELTGESQNVAEGRPFSWE